MLCKELRIKIANVAMELRKKYKVLLTLMLATSSVLAIYYISIIAILIMDVCVKLLLQANIINYEQATMGGIVYILIIPVFIVWMVFNVRSKGEWIFKKHILDYSEYYKCSFSLILFLVALILLKNQYWPIEDASKVFFQNQSFWGIPLITFFFRVMLDYYLLEKKDLQNVEGKL